MPECLKSDEKDCDTDRILDIFEKILTEEEGVNLKKFQDNWSFLVQEFRLIRIWDEEIITYLEKILFNRNQTPRRITLITIEETQKLTGIIKITLNSYNSLKEKETTKEQSQVMTTLYDNLAKIKVVINGG